MKFKVLLLDKEIEIDHIDRLTISTNDGQRTFLKNQMASLIAIDEGKGYYIDNETTTHFEVGEGILNVEKTQLTLITSYFREKID